MPAAGAPQRIAYLTSHYPAVSHTFILREVEALRALGFDIRTASIRRSPGGAHQGPEERAAEASTFYVLSAARRLTPLLAAQARALRDPRRYFGALRLAFATSAPGWRAHLWQLFYFAEATLLADFIDRERIGHLHNHFADVSANVALLAAHLADIPFSYTLHGPAELYEPQRWHLREKTARAAFVACISHFARSQAMYFSDPEHWPKLRIVHCGVIPERYETPRTEPDIAPETGTHLVFVGRLTAIKGLRVLLDAFARAHAQDPTLRLTLVGDGDDRAHLERLAVPMGDAVRFAGYRSQAEVAAILSTADIFVLPSFAEGVPVVLMEAMASGVPVITSLVAGIPELVADGTHGYLVPPGDAETLAARILDLAGDPDARARMGAAGREKVRAEFDIRTEAARIGALFSGAGGDDPRPDPIRAEG